MEILAIILLLFVVGIAFCLLIGGVFYIGFFVAIGFVFLLLTATCMEISKDETTITSDNNNHNAQPASHNKNTDPSRQRQNHRTQD